MRVTTTREDKVSEFNEAAGQAKGWDYLALELRLKLLREEFYELELEVADAIYLQKHHKREPGEEHKAAILKEMCDLQYVLSGLAVSLDLPLEEAFNRVHANNMTKLGGPVREDGKIMKPEGYKKVNLEDMV